MVDRIKEIAQGKVEIFDEKILNLEIREIIFKIILNVTSNVFMPVESEEYFRKLFEENTQKYVIALSLDSRSRSGLGINSQSNSPRSLFVEGSIRNNSNGTHSSNFDKNFPKMNPYH